MNECPDKIMFPRQFKIIVNFAWFLILPFSDSKEVLIGGFEKHCPGL